MVAPKFRTCFNFEKYPFLYLSPSPQITVLKYFQHFLLLNLVFFFGFGIDAKGLSLAFLVLSNMSVTGVCTQNNY